MAVGGSTSIKVEKKHMNFDRKAMPEKNAVNASVEAFHCAMLNNACYCTTEY